MVIMASGNRKKRKDGKSREEALEEAIKECENLLKKPKNPRKLVEYEFHREPITGIRETTTPYRPTEFFGEEESEKKKNSLKSL